MLLKGKKGEGRLEVAEACEHSLDLRYPGAYSILPRACLSGFLFTLKKKQSETNLQQLAGGQ